LVFLGAQRCGLKNRQRVFLCQHFHRAGHQLFAAAGRTIGLSEDTDNLMLRRQQRVKMTRCKIRCTGENNA